VADRKVGWRPCTALSGCRCSPNAAVPGGIWPACWDPGLTAAARGRAATSAMIPTTPMHPTGQRRWMAAFKVVPVPGCDGTSPGRPGGQAQDPRRIRVRGEWINHIPSTHGGMFLKPAVATLRGGDTGYGGQVYLDAPISHAQGGLAQPGPFRRRCLPPATCAQDLLPFPRRGGPRGRPRRSSAPIVPFLPGHPHTKVSAFRA